jgi:hypothetical protein
LLAGYFLYLQLFFAWISVIDYSLALMVVVLMNQAYVGYASDMNAVVVVFRGTQETRYIAYHFMISVYFFSKY